MRQLDQVGNLFLVRVQIWPQPRAGAYPETRLLRPDGDKPLDIGGGVGADGIAHVPDQRQVITNFLLGWEWPRVRILAIAERAVGDTLNQVRYFDPLCLHALNRPTEARRGRQAEGVGGRVGGPVGGVNIAALGIEQLLLYWLVYI